VPCLLFNQSVFIFFVQTTKATMKFTLTLSIFLAFIQLSTAQKYSRVKVFANEQELISLSSLGVPTDHGLSKKGTFFISDFSEQEIQILNTYGYNYDIQIDDVQAFT